MSKDPKQTTDELSAAQEVEVIVSKSERFVNDNKKTIGGVLLAVLLILGGFFAYKYLYAQPREKAASEAIFRAEHYFGVDSFSIALNGDGAQTKGFLDVISKYGSTKAGNLAKGYAGICYFHLGDYDNALTYLKKYSGKDAMLAPTIQGLMGDCYVQKGDYKSAVSLFESAASSAKNDVISPIYLKKAGLAYEALNDNANALKCYEKIKDEYINSEEAASIQKYIERLSLK